MDEAVSGSEMNLTNGTPMDSEPESDTFSDNGDVADLNADKLDPSERALYEKLKQQEREEREEIERELKEHEEALAIHNTHLRAREKEMHLAQERMQQRSERELDLSRPSSNKSLSNGNGNANNGNGAPDTGIGGGTSSNGAPKSSGVMNNKNSIMSFPGNNIMGNTNNNNNNKNLGIGGNLIKNNGDNSLDTMSKFLADDFRAHLHNSANFLSSFPLGHPLAHAHLALGGHLLGREMKGLEVVNPFHPILPNHSAFPSPPSPAERYPPSSTTPMSPAGSLQPSPSPDDPNGDSRSHNWTFEEQFKQ
ncbi:unnamed protein product, partial [Lymnaea stagnalis]